MVQPEVQGAPAGFSEATIELNPDLELCSPEAFAAYRAAGCHKGRMENLAWT